MSLSTPAFDSINKIDQRLEELRKEVKFLEEEYGFTESTPEEILRAKDSLNVIKEIPLKENRYNSLPNNPPVPEKLPKKAKPPKYLEKSMKENIEIPSLPYEIPQPKLVPADFEFEMKREQEIGENIDQLVENWFEVSLLN